MMQSGGQGSILIGDQLFTTPGTYEWLCPLGINSVSVVCIGAGGSGGGVNPTTRAGAGGGGGGLGWKNNIPVIPGKRYTVVVGAGGVSALNTPNGAGGNGGDSYFIDTTIVAGRGGTGGGHRNANPDAPIKFPGGEYVGDGGGRGGTGGAMGPPATLPALAPFWTGSNYAGGGGGAGGYGGPGTLYVGRNLPAATQEYSGRGGRGTDALGGLAEGGASDWAGGAGGGGAITSTPLAILNLTPSGAGGGGTDLYGVMTGTYGADQGPISSPPNSGPRINLGGLGAWKKPGSFGGGTGTNGQSNNETSMSDAGGPGGNYGGGGGGNSSFGRGGAIIISGLGAPGAVRIIWPGDIRQFPLKVCDNIINVRNLPY
jgi:hypothetical protein